jgi:hypothetical protein
MLSDTFKGPVPLLYQIFPFSLSNAFNPNMPLA